MENKLAQVPSPLDVDFPGAPYVRSKTENVSSGGSNTFDFRGKNANAFGITRIFAEPLAAATNYEFTVTLKRKSGEDTIFSDIPLPVVNEFFDQYTMRIPMVVERAQEFQIILNDTGANGVDFNVMVEGLPCEQLRVFQQHLIDQFGEVPRSEIMYATGSVPANSTLQPVQFNIPNGTWLTDRILFGVIDTSPLTNSSYRLRLVKETETFIEESPMVQFNRLVRNGWRMTSGFTVEEFRTVETEVTNNTGSATTVGAFSEIISANALC